MLSNPEQTAPRAIAPKRHLRETRTHGGWIPKHLRPALEWLVRQRGSPQEIARGVAVGIFVALTPTVGFQIAIAACLATLFNANRSVAILGVWITNPFTVAPIFAFTYALGIGFWPGPPLSGVGTTVSLAADQVAMHGVWEFDAQLQAIMHMGADILVPLTIGGAVAGAVCAAIAYAATIALVRRARRSKSGCAVRTAKRHAKHAATRAIAKATRTGDDAALRAGTPA